MCSVRNGSDSPPDCHSLPFLVRIPLLLLSKNKKHHIGVVPVRIQRQFYSPRRVLLLRSDICLATSVIAFGSFRANKISLKPRGFNITLPLGKITL